MNKKSILITGATGFVGGHLCEFFHAHGYSVTGLISPRKCPDKSRLQSKLSNIVDFWIETDLNNPDFDIEGEYDYVIHSAAIARPGGVEPDLYIKVNAEGTAKFLANIKDQVREKIIVISSMAAVGPATDDKSRDESVPCIPADLYGKSKLEQEKVALQSGLPVIILRPPTIFGSRDREVMKFYNAVAAGIFPIRSNLKCIEYLYIGNLVKAVGLLLEKGKINEIYHISNGERYSLDEILHSLEKVSGHKLYPIKVPVLLFKAMGFCLEVLFNFLKKQPPFKRSTADWMIAPYWQIDDTKIRTLGYSPDTDLEKAFQETFSGMQMQSIFFKTSLPRVGFAYLYRLLFKKIALDFPAPISYSKIATPSLPSENHVKIKTLLCGICGTELSILGVNLSPKSAALAFSGDKTKAPMSLGHEVVGRIEEVGGNVKDFKPGDRVIITDDNSCAVLGKKKFCEYCTKGQPILCLNRNEKKFSQFLAGGWSEYFVRHQKQLVKIPDTLPEEKAVLVEPMSVSLHSVLRQPPEEGNKIMILGAGIIGLGIVSALRALNLKNLYITVSAYHLFQEKVAKSLGADRVYRNEDIYKELATDIPTDLYGKGKNRILNRGLDIIYDCVGTPETINHCLRWLKPRGKLVLVGMNMVPGAIDFTPIWQREISIVGVHGYAVDDWEGVHEHTVHRCIKWIESGRMNVDDLVTHTFPLKEYKKAIKASTSHHGKSSESAEEEKAIKVVFDFRQEKI